ncbi:MAG TPA: peptidylprolyl isomerase [Bryobacteraceae bacterium]|jgi:peptidyl-prolyl cis-trans isomerase A (cyclophilin A)|nr:peptidylprolyl isomerase [Bryobacteraceae bacterium]
MKLAAILVLFAATAFAQAPAAPASAAKAPAAPQLEPGLYATFYTSMGNIVCRLYEKEAPLTVANFRGLAMGTKWWTDPKTKQRTRRPLYSGTIFHRVIPNFMIQGGDPLGTGMGSPGYTFKNEDNQYLFDKKGVLAMANAGRDTNGSQFFITVAPYPSLNGGYTVFGQVIEGQDVADRISEVPRDEAAGDRPLTPVKISRIAIRRVRAPGTPAARPAARKAVHSPASAAHK